MTSSTSARRLRRSSRRAACSSSALAVGPLVLETGGWIFSLITQKTQAQPQNWDTVNFAPRPLDANSANDVDPRSGPIETALPTSLRRSLHERRFGGAAWGKPIDAERARRESNPEMQSLQRGLPLH